MIQLNTRNNDVVKKIILQSLKEDIGTGDITSVATISKLSILSGQFIAKDNGVISGLKIVNLVFQLLNKNIVFNACLKNGSIIEAGQIIADIKGSGRSILAGERIALNFLQRMSGIATLTRQYVKAVSGTKAVILDTRKTVPGLRVLDKQAVRDGGGRNHRFGLFDMYLIKDNHIAAAGSITKAFHAVKKQNKNLLIEIEVKNFKELDEALSLQPDRIMLDNMDLKQIHKAVTKVDSKFPIEVSGGVNLETVSQIAQTGVDYISVGALTHSVKALDISLEIKNE